MAWSDNLPINSGYSWKEGTTTGSYNMNYVKTWMEWLVTTDSANNRSIINVKMYSQVIQGGSASDMAKWTTAEDFGYAGYDNGYRVYRNTTYDFNNYNRNCFADATLYVPHNADGTKSITLQTAFTTHSSTVTGGSVSENLTLTAIPRGTELISVTGRNYGYPSTFNLSRKASAMRERVTMTYGGDTLTIKDTDNADVNFTFTLDRNKTPNTAKPSSSTWTIAVATYNGATLVETKTYSYAWSIKDGDDANYAPVISVNPVCTALNSGFTGAIPALGTDTCVAQYSKLRVSANKADITTKYGAEIYARWVDFSSGHSSSGVNYTNYDTGIQYSAGVVSWTYTVRDGRGFTATKTGTFDVLAYNAPTLEIKECYRGNSSQVASDSGTYIWVKAKYTISSLNSHNSATLKAQATGFSQATLTNDTRASIASSASPSNAYGVTFTVTDLLRTVTYSGSIKAEDVPLDIKENGRGVGIGAYATSTDTLEVGYKTHHTKEIELQETGSSNTILIDKYGIQETFPVSGNDGYSHSAFLTGSSLQERLQHYEGGVVTEDFQSMYNADYARLIRIKNGKTIRGFFRPEAIYLEGADGHDRISICGATNIGACMQVDYRYALTCNLLDSALIEQGNISESSGAEVASTNRLRSGFCGVKASTSYTLSMSSSAEFKIALEYNSSKGYVGYKFLSGTSCTFTTDANVAFVRITIGFSNDGTITPSNVSNVQLEKGSQASSFVPFTMDGVEVAERCREWKQIGSFSAQNDTATLPSYATEMMIVPVIHSFIFNAQHYILAVVGLLNEGNVYQDSTYHVSYSFKREYQTLTCTGFQKVGWSNVNLAIFVK